MILNSLLRRKKRNELFLVYLFPVCDAVDNLVRAVLKDEVEGGPFDLMYLKCGFEVVICEIGEEFTLFLILLDKLMVILKVVQKHHTRPDGGESMQ
jgi:hypothetical protein